MYSTKNNNQNFNRNDNSIKAETNERNYTLSIYIVMKLLKVINRNMGLEAMLEYVDKYIEKSENRHPQFPTAFSLAMSKQKLGTIYENTINYKKT